MAETIQKGSAGMYPWRSPRAAHPAGTATAIAGSGVSAAERRELSELLSAEEVWREYTPSGCAAANQATMNGAAVARALPSSLE